MKKYFTVVLMVLIFICIGAMVLQTVGADVAKEFNICSDAKHFKDGKKKKGPPAFTPVKLTHEKHAKEYGKDGKGYGCKICHHELKDDSADEQAKAKKCSTEGCHSVEPQEKRLELEKAMHQQCYKDCHKNDEQAVAAKAPTKCGDCHVKTDK